MDLRVPTPMKSFPRHGETPAKPPGAWFLSVSFWVSFCFPSLKTCVCVSVCVWGFLGGYLVFVILNGSEKDNNIGHVFGGS